MIGPQLQAIALATGCLSPRQVKLAAGMIAEIDRLDRRKTALKAAVSALNPDGDLSTWQTALALESRLKWFSGTPMARILAGYRLPTTLEVNLLTLADSGPQCARKLWAEIRELL